MNLSYKNIFPRSIKIFILSALLFSLIPCASFSQDVNIIQYLKQIENGKADEVRNELTGLKEEYPESPSVMFLEGVLTENGQQAVVIYQKIVDDFPQSNYADAALYRIYSYYYALGLYESASKKLEQLINQYPESPYIKIAKQNQLPTSPEITQEENQTVQTDSTTQIHEYNYKYTIQAGAFSSRLNAEALQNKFEKSGIFSEVRDKLVAGTTFHVVYAGKFINEDDAEFFLKTINDKFDLSGRVIEIPR